MPAPDSIVTYMAAHRPPLITGTLPTKNIGGGFFTLPVMDLLIMINIILLNYFNIILILTFFYYALRLLFEQK